MGLSLPGTNPSDLKARCANDCSPTFDSGRSAAGHGETAACFLGVISTLMYAYVERKQIPHYRRSVRFRLSELAEWRQPIKSMEESKHVNQQRKAP